MRNRAKETLKRIRSAFKAFITIIRKEKHVFYCDEYCSVDANIKDMIRYSEEMKYIIELAVDKKQMHKISEEINQILNKEQL